MAAALVRIIILHQDQQFVERSRQKLMFLLASGATVIQNLSIGSGAIVGAGVWQKINQD